MVINQFYTPALARLKKQLDHRMFGKFEIQIDNQQNILLNLP